MQKVERDLQESGISIVTDALIETTGGLAAARRVVEGTVTFSFGDGIDTDHDGRVGVDHHAIVREGRVRRLAPTVTLELALVYRNRHNLDVRLGFEIETVL